MEDAMKRNASLMLVFLAVVAMSGGAEANCAEGNYYGTDVMGRTVVVCLLGQVYSYDACTFQGGLIRENVETGEVVRLADHHDAEQDTEQDAEQGECCVDECVPPGTYRYGLVEPFDCIGAACGGTPFYEEVEVEDHNLACSLSEDNPGTTAYDGDPPWHGDGDGMVCESVYSDGPFGCMVAQPGARAVFGFNALFAALGLSVLLARRLRRRG
jgi:hypothetical protein